MGLDFGRRIGRYLEGVDLIRRLFTGGNVNFFRGAISPRTT